MSEHMSQNGYRYIICRYLYIYQFLTETQARRKRYVQRMQHERVKREVYKECDKSAVFGLQFDYLDSYLFQLNASYCYCGNDSDAVRGWPHLPMAFTNNSVPTDKNYYPGDVYSYYAVTLDPWDAALESDR